MMTVTQLEYLLALDKHRHFGRAAKACFVTQPTLSMQIQKLEEDLGAALFDRSKKPILPTDAGLRVITQARAALAELKKVELVASMSTTTLEGPFHIGVIPTLSPYIVPLFAPAFAAAHPKVELRIEELQTRQILQRLQDDELDAGLLVTPVHAPVSVDVLFYEPFVLYVSKEHELAKKKHVGEGALDGCDVWLLTDGHCLAEQAMRLCNPKKKRTRMPNVSFESGDIETLCRLVEGAGGFTLVPQLAVDDRLQRNDRAVLVPFESPAPVREVSLVMGRRTLKQPHSKALATIIRDVVPKSLPREKTKAHSVVPLRASSR